MTRPIPIACEQCRTGQIFEMPVRVDVTSEPQGKEDILTGKLHTFTCVKCKFSKVYDFPLLYEDRKKKMYLLVVRSKGDAIQQFPLPPQLKTAQLRRVESRNELIEKILIRDAKLDDRVVEYLKVQVRFSSLQRSMPVDGNLMFSGVVKDDDDEGDLVQFQDVTGSNDDTFMSFPLPYYRKYAKMLKPFIEQMPKPDSEWLSVDHVYGKQLDQLVEKESKIPKRNKRAR